LYSRKAQIEYEGKIAFGANAFDNQLFESYNFSDRFKALWHFIVEDIETNRSITSLKEYCSKMNRDKSSHDLDIYMVVQNERFLISEKYKIYAYTTLNSENNDDKEKKKYKSINKIEKIKIELYSYHVNVQTIKQYVDDLTEKYNIAVQNMRDNKRFIYKQVNTKWEDSTCEMWSEVLFNSTRSFDNLFFDGKDGIKVKIDFFLQNMAWYYEKGIPYSLGIGLHGPPGTGKTSFIKALANYTNRHIVVISLKTIKTKKQLDTIFFEDRYNSDNKKGSITFEKKIIVFEDIDCIGDIVMDRDKKKQKEQKANKSRNVEELLATLVDGDDKSQKQISCLQFPVDDPITLDDILNLWDGLQETPGRILIITSNKYHDLDKALIRPGRIDITLELSYVSRPIIREMYRHFFKEDIDEDILAQIKDRFYVPAEIVNIYLNDIHNKQQFLDRLIQNVSTT
jgi:chaperone BCS1